MVKNPAPAVRHVKLTSIPCDLMCDVKVDSRRCWVAQAARAKTSVRMPRRRFSPPCSNSKSLPRQRTHLLTGCATKYCTHCPHGNELLPYEDSECLNPWPANLTHSFTQRDALLVVSLEPGSHVVGRAGEYGKMQARLPKDWPEDAKYLRAPAYSKKLTKDKLDTLLLSKASMASKEQALITRGPYPNVKITRISHASHPAQGQYGLYATEHLPPDSFILPYLGFVHDQTESDETSDYDLSLDRDLGVGVDASKMGNEARFINDYRGISTGPNAEFRDILVDVGFGIVEKRMGVFALSAGKSGKRAKGIGRSEEILVSYGKGFWTERKPVIE